MEKPKTAFLFPGQGSQILGMGRELFDAFGSARLIYKEAEDILGFYLTDLCWNGPEEKLNDTINTQPALLTLSIAALKVLQEQRTDIVAAYVAGHSMGELSALVASHALLFPDALRLARMRGLLMKKAGEIKPGGMAAIIGLDIHTMDAICSQASAVEGIIQVANDNCPGQVVISGETRALDLALNFALQAGARRVVKLAVSIAAHSPLMEDAQQAFNQAVNSAPIQDPTVPLVGNVTAKSLITALEIRNDLQDQLTKRVRWTESIQYMVHENVIDFIELGSGSVLTGLVKRIDRNVNAFNLSTPADFERFLTK